METKSRFMKDLQYELRDSIYGGYSFIDKIEAEEGFTITKLDDENIEDVEEMIFRANQFQKALELLEYFVDRVEKGEIKSKTTYNKYKEFLKTI